MRLLSGFLLGLLCRPVVRLLGILIVLALVSGAVLNTGQDTAGALGRGQAATIIRAVDGDTLLVRTSGQEQRVRVLAIDTPETVKPGAPVQRCGPEASARAKSWAAAHRTVRLQTDPAAPNSDRYGRLLRYIQPTEGGRDLSTVQVAAGLARIAAYGQDLDKLPDLRRTQTRAKSANRGLWGSSCTTR